jgi:hypothetical protein
MKYITGLLIACVSVAAFAHPIYPSPPTDDYHVYKPTGDESADTALGMCRLFSKVAKAKNVRTLIIGFEGLFSFDSSGTDAAYNYLWSIVHKVSATEPGPGSAGYVLHGLMVPLIQHYGGAIEFLMFPQTAQGDESGSIPEICAIEWMKVPGRELVIIGHSYGGHAANQLAAALEEARVPIEFVFTLDPRLKNYVGTLGRTKNAAYWKNFFQTNTLFLNGYVVPGADQNIDLSSTGVGHTGVPFAPEVYQGVTKRLVP